MPSRREARLRHATYYLASLKQANELYKQGREKLEEGLTLFDLESDSINAAQAWTERYTKDEQVASLCTAMPT
ncbi:MAG: hypothetical protein AABN95_01950 [Acidobacteriota bacterium]